MYINKSSYYMLNSSRCLCYYLEVKTFEKFDLVLVFIKNTYKNLGIIIGKHGPPLIYHWYLFHNVRTTKIKYFYTTWLWFVTLYLFDMKPVQINY